MLATRGGLIGLAIAVVLAIPACRRDHTVPAPPPATAESPVDAPATERVVGPLSAGDAEALATMNDRIKEYIVLHQKLEQMLPPVEPKNATPEQIDQNQRALEKLVRQHRSAARRGDIFTPTAEPVIKRLLATVFGGPDGKQLKSSIMDENPVGIKLALNARYPDTVPLSTVPPEVLQTLPKLPEELEYRFLGNRLIILDVHAHVVADFIEDALP
jgi:hypothetical protein